MCETEISSRNSERKQLTSDLKNWSEGLRRWKQVDEKFLVNDPKKTYFPPPVSHKKKQKT